MKIKVRYVVAPPDWAINVKPDDLVPGSVQEGSEVELVDSNDDRVRDVIKSLFGPFALPVEVEVLDDEQKSLSDIIEDCREAKRPEYDDLRYAVLALASLLTFTLHDMLKILEKTDESEAFGPHSIATENFNRTHRVYKLAPKQYLGEDGDPDRAVYQDRRQIARKILQKAKKQVDDEQK